MADPLSSLIRPDRGPSLPSLDRFAPPPPMNLVVAEIEARSSPGDVVIDLHGRGGWIARAAIGRRRRPSPRDPAPPPRRAPDVVSPPPPRPLSAPPQTPRGAGPGGEVGLRQA